MEIEYKRVYILNQIYRKPNVKINQYINERNVDKVDHVWINFSYILTSQLKGGEGIWITKADVAKGTIDLGIVCSIVRQKGWHKKTTKSGLVFVHPFFADDYVNCLLVPVFCGHLNPRRGIRVISSLLHPVRVSNEDGQVPILEQKMLEETTVLVSETLVWIEEKMRIN